MRTVAFLSVAPVIEGSMAEEVAKAIEALEAFDVEYETTSMGTIIEAEDPQTIFDAAGAAHEAVDADRVSTFLKIDDQLGRAGPAARKVESVERYLQRPARSRSDR